MQMICAFGASSLDLWVSPKNSKLQSPFSGQFEIIARSGGMHFGFKGSLPFFIVRPFDLVLSFDSSPCGRGVLPTGSKTQEKPGSQWTIQESLCKDTSVFIPCI